MACPKCVLQLMSYSTVLFHNEYLFILRSIVVLVNMNSKCYSSRRWECSDLLMDITASWTTEPIQFHQMHKAYLDRNGVPADRRQPSIQGTPIDLHILHLEMMKVGDLLNVGFFFLFYLASRSHVCSVACGCVESRRLDDIRAVIGGKCGIVHQPADGKEPPSVIKPARPLFNRYTIRSSLASTWRISSPRCPGWELANGLASRIPTRR